MTKKEIKEEIAEVLNVKHLHIDDLCSNVITSMRDVAHIRIYGIVGSRHAIEFVYKSDTQDFSQIVIEDYIY